MTIDDVFVVGSGIGGVCVDAATMGRVAGQVAATRALSQT